MEPPEFAVWLLREGSEGILTWEPTDDLASLERGLAKAVHEAFGVGQLHRLSARVDPSDAVARRALHRQGFRYEGLLRGAQPLPGDTFGDLRLYARLVTDVTDGREGFTSVMNTVTPRKRLIAHALVTDVAGRVLLCETSFKPDWELPGGIVEPRESPADGLVREMTEEMGWAPAVQRPLVVDWLRPYLGWDDAVELVFATQQVSDADRARLAPDGLEILGLHWVEPEEFVARMTPFGAARASSALRALAEGVTLYTEGGRTTPHR
ncbi:NUDIX hydrolase [Propioniciclava soli]|uniref:NUDIX hydrolase n=1 Tax=Propioniciclava soli TaxID=2775081 RepID=UPI001E556CD7